MKRCTGSNVFLYFHNNYNYNCIPVFSLCWSNVVLLLQNMLGDVDQSGQETSS